MWKYSTIVGDFIFRINYKLYKLSFMAKLTIRSERDLPGPSFSGKWGNYNLEEIGFVQIIQFIG